MNMGRVTKQSGARTVRKLWMAMPLAFFAVGCGGEMPEDTGAPVADEALAETEQAVGLAGSYWWGTTNNGNTTTNLGTATDRTCFLTGVQGNLKPTVAGNSSFVGLYIYNGDWWVTVTHFNSKALSAGVQCISTDTNRTAEVTWTEGTAAKLLGAVTGQRRCFLTRVESRGGFVTNADHVRVWNDGLNWYLGGDLSAAGGARARCVDVPTEHSGWHYIAGDPGGFTANMAYDPGGVACLLSGIGGHFTANSFTDGVSIDYNSGTRYWEMTVVNGKRGWSSCVK